MTATVIKSASLSSAFYVGAGSENEKVFGQTIGKLWEGVVDLAKGALEMAKGLLNRAKEGLKGLIRRWTSAEKPSAKEVATGLLIVGIGVVIVSVVAVAAISAAPVLAPVAALGLKVGALAVGGLIAAAKLFWVTFGAKGVIVAASALTIGWFFNSFVRAASFLWNFNWNLSDSELTKQQEMLINQLSALLGSALGQVLGTTICGSVAGAIATKFNPTMAIHIKKELGEEVYEEVLSGIWGLAYGTQRIVFGWIFRESFKQIRRFVKWLASKLPKGGPEFLKRWGDEGRQPWVFSQKFEDAVEAIPNAQIRSFVENFFDEFFDACGDIIIVTGGIASVT